MIKESRPRFRPSKQDSSDLAQEYQPLLHPHIQIKVHLQAWTQHILIYMKMRLIRIQMTTMKKHPAMVWTLVINPELYQRYKDSHVVKHEKQTIIKQ